MGAGIHSANSSPQLANLLVTGNQASCDGGGLYATGGSLTLANVTIDANSSERYGGGVYAVDTTLRLVNAVVKRNSMAAAGGHLAHRTSSRYSMRPWPTTMRRQDRKPGGSGAGLCVERRDPQLDLRGQRRLSGGGSLCSVRTHCHPLVRHDRGRLPAARYLRDHAVTGVPQWVQPRLTCGWLPAHPASMPATTPTYPRRDGRRWRRRHGRAVPVDPQRPRFFDDPVADTGSGTHPSSTSAPSRPRRSRQASRWRTSGRLTTVSPGPWP